MTDRQFNGFDRDFLMILAENRFNDSKVYYDSVKDKIKQAAITPMRHLCADLSEQLFAIDEEMNLIPSKMVSRIRRDTRIAKNENMYRDNIWAMFMRDKYIFEHSPAMWFEVAPGSWSCGIGLYRAEPAVMEAYRTVILKYPAQFKCALNCAKKAGAVPDIEQYKRPKPGTEQLEKAIQPFFNSKYLWLMCYETELEPLFDGSIEDILSEKINAFRPMYKFLSEVVKEYNRKKIGE